MREDNKIVDVYVKELPEICDDCPCHNTEWICCNIDSDIVPKRKVMDGWEEDCRPDNCPLHLVSEICP